jgi:hypothetical protein
MWSSSSGIQNVWRKEQFVILTKNSLTVALGSSSELLDARTFRLSLLGVFRGDDDDDDDDMEGGCIDVGEEDDREDNENEDDDEVDDDEANDDADDDDNDKGKDDDDDDDCDNEDALSLSPSPLSAITSSSKCIDASLPTASAPSTAVCSSLVSRSNHTTRSSSSVLPSAESASSSARGT